MPLKEGQQLSHYRIDRKIGQGGMGEVWAATDTRLNRAAAIKVLPESLAHDPERLARFRREAQLLATLNHPNIAGIYGFEQEGETSYLAMEMVEGVELEAKIQGQGLPLDEALDIARQLAAALEEAHDKGIVHRDLKPANIKIAPDGRVKVLDFGLAKALEGENPGAGSSTDLSLSPTMTAAMGTRAGVIMGTAAYMSPEQARGKAVDGRTDIWAFGAVLLEMLSGRRIFKGDTATDIIAAVLTQEPNWQRLPPETPASVRRLLRRCLQKDPRQRLRHIADARFDLNDEPGEPVISSPAGRLETRSSRWVWLTAVAGIVAGVALTALAFTILVPRQPPARHIWSALRPPPGAPFEFGSLMEISPDGKHVAFVAPAGGAANLLWVRDLESEKARPLSGTKDAYQPFWSPDSKFIGYSSHGKLHKISMEGGVSTALCDVGAAPRGAAWGRDGTILFVPDWSQPVFRVPDRGGTPIQVTRLDADRRELSHRWPHFLPDGEHFLYYTVSTYPGLNPKNPSEADRSGLYAGSLQGMEPRLVQRVRSRAVYSSGWLLFVNDGVLMARRFDTESLELQNSLVSLAAGVTQSADALWGAALFSVSDEGTLLFIRGAAENRGVSRIVLRDRQGAEIQTLGEPAAYNGLRLSHDGKRVATSIDDPADVWILDLEDGGSTRFTFDPGNDMTPQWSPDDSRIMFQSSRVIPGQKFTPANLMTRLISGLESAQYLTSLEAFASPSDWSAEGRLVALRSFNPKTGIDILIYSVDDQTIQPFLKTKANEDGPRFSPDGQWLAYISDESGRQEIMVQASSAQAGKWQVSSAGGRFPVWRADGNELFYLDLDGVLMAVPTKTGGAFRSGTPTPLFTAKIQLRSGTEPDIYDATPDGQRFLFLEPQQDTGATAATATLVQNWPSLLP